MVHQAGMEPTMGAGLSPGPTSEALQGKWMCSVELVNVAVTVAFEPMRCKSGLMCWCRCFFPFRKTCIVGRWRVFALRMPPTRPGQG